MSLTAPTMTAGFESLLTIKDVIAITRLSKSKAYQLIEDGVLKTVTIPGCAKKLVAPAELRRFLGIDTVAA
jgi:hypothetical protein